MKKTSMLFAGLLVAVGTAKAQVASVEPEQGVSFELRADRSRFDVGANAREESVGMVHRTVGERGSIMRDTVTGATLAELSASGTPKSRAQVNELPRGFTEDAQEHNAAVRRYLIESGVPQQEIAGAHVTTTMAGGGSVEAGLQPSTSTFLWYTTHLERAINGISVESSFAFAALDKQGRAITEGAFWPAIPVEVVRRAQSLKQRLEAADTRAQFLGRLSQVRPDIAAAPGEVKIVHTGPSHHGTFEARAVYTVVSRPVGGGKAQVLRFDEQGVAVRLADEVALKAMGDSVKER